MALPPTRRQKRPIILISDNEEDVIPSGHCLSQTISCSSGQVKSTRINGDSISSQPVPKRSRPKTRSSTLKSRSSTSAQSTQPASLEHSSRTSKACKSEKSRSLHAYFSAADFIRHTVAPRKSSINEAEVSQQKEEEEDVIEDDVSEREFPRPSSLRNTTRFVLDRRKQPVASSPRDLEPPHSAKHKISSQIYTIPRKALSEHSSQSTPSIAKNDNDDPRPWADQYGPTSLDELMVHKQKVADVRNWMEKFWQDGNQRVCGLEAYSCANADVVQEAVGLERTGRGRQDCYGHGCSESSAYSCCRMDEPERIALLLRGLSVNVRPV